MNDKHGQPIVKSLSAISLGSKSFKLNNRNRSTSTIEASTSDNNFNEYDEATSSSNSDHKTTIGTNTYEQQLEELRQHANTNEFIVRVEIFKRNRYENKLKKTDASPFSLMKLVVNGKKVVVVRLDIGSGAQGSVKRLVQIKLTRDGTELIPLGVEKAIHLNPRRHSQKQLEKRSESFREEYRLSKKVYSHLKKRHEDKKLHALSNYWPEVTVQKHFLQLPFCGKPINKLPPDRNFMTRLKQIISFLSALGELHGKNIIHADLHNKNVLADGNKMTIIDLGCALEVTRVRRFFPQHRGKIDIATPSNLRQFEKEKPSFEYSRSTDLYSACIILYELLGAHRFLANRSLISKNNTSYVKGYKQKLMAKAAFDYTGLWNYDCSDIDNATQIETITLLDSILHSEGKCSSVTELLGYFQKIEYGILQSAKLHRSPTP